VASRIIILEGPDGAGKTVLARHLQERYHIAYRHEGPTPADRSPLLYYGGILDACRDVPVVFDRFALGERVYGPLLRGGDRLGDLGWHVFQYLVHAVGAVQILCLPPYDVCLRNWRGRAHELFTDERLLRASYRAFESAESWHDYTYDYTVDVEADLMTALDRRVPCALPEGMLGGPAADILLVGDRGADPTAPLDLPFYSTAGSSGYLFTTLALAKLDATRVALINAYRHDGSAWPIPHTYRRVVALGHAAAQACRQQHVPHTTIPHPQYWRRFHRHDIMVYVQRLQEALA